MRKKKGTFPTKRSMNLYYKPDRTTKPATIALYVLFALVCLLGLAKFLVYDVIQQTAQARNEMQVAQNQLDSVLVQLTDYDEVYERYCRYSATDEEAALIDRMDVLALLEYAVTAKADMGSVAISGDTVQIQFSGVTLAETALIVNTLEASPIVASTVVNTASTTQQEAAAGLVQANVLIHLQQAETEAETE